MIVVHLSNGSNVVMDNPANVSSKDIEKRVNEELGTTLRLYNHVFNFKDVLYIEVMNYGSRESI